MDLSKAWSFPVGFNFMMGTKTTDKNLKVVPVIISVALGSWETELRIRTCCNGQLPESVVALLFMYTALYNMEQNVHYFSVLLKEMKKNKKKYSQNSVSAIKNKAIIPLQWMCICGGDCREVHIFGGLVKQVNYPAFI